MVPSIGCGFGLRLQRDLGEIREAGIDFGFRDRVLQRLRRHRGSRGYGVGKGDPRLYRDLDGELGLIQDGAVLVNTARAWVIDGDALLRELATGRFWAALDVYDEEPLPADHALRSMENVLLTPHVAGRTVESHASLMGEMVDEAVRFLRGEPLQHPVTADMLPTMA